VNRFVASVPAHGDTDVCRQKARQFLQQGLEIAGKPRGHAQHHPACSVAFGGERHLGDGRVGADEDDVHAGERDDPGGHVQPERVALPGGRRQHGRRAP
jgi:hypothetical protein